jgi:hypothetical protein
MWNIGHSTGLGDILLRRADFASFDPAFRVNSFPRAFVRGWVDDDQGYWNCAGMFTGQKVVRIGKRGMLNVDAPSFLPPEPNGLEISGSATPSFYAG